MANICVCCNHPKRLQIDRDIIQGVSNSVIAKKYGLANPDLVGRHAKSHLSKQLVTAWHQKDLDESMDLLNRIDLVLKRAERIFKRNYSAGKDGMALKALSEQRQVFQLLSNISFQLHQARLAELEIAQREDGTHEGQESERFYEQIAEILTDHELMLLNKLLEKAQTGDTSIDVVREYLPDPLTIAMLEIERAYVQAETPEQHAEATEIASKFIPCEQKPGVDRPYWSGLDDPQKIDPRKRRGPSMPLVDDDPPEPDPDPADDPADKPMQRTKKRGPGRPPGSRNKKTDHRRSKRGRPLKAKSTT